MSRHPNDKNPHDAACESALNKIDAQAGQGVDAFYAMAFRDGWQAHGAAGASEGQAEPRQTVPRKLTLRMVGAFQEYWKHTQNIYGAWAAMLDAAPNTSDPSAEIAALRERIAGMEKDAIRSLIARHAEELEQNDYAYFELAYTRRTGWMAWICSNSRDDDPNRKVLACGQGDTPDEACDAAIAKERS